MGAKIFLPPAASALLPALRELPPMPLASAMGAAQAAGHHSLVRKRRVVLSFRCDANPARDSQSP